MKVLTFYTREFSYTPAVKSLDSAPEVSEGNTIHDAVLALIQVEEDDEDKDLKSREKKLANHLKWVTRKNKSKNIILHSFAHLGESKASQTFSKQILDAAEVRLQNGGYTTHQTPYGYFLDLKIDAPGFSLARVWQSL